MWHNKIVDSAPISLPNALWAVSSLDVIALIARIADLISILNILEMWLLSDVH